MADIINALNNQLRAAHEHLKTRNWVQSEEVSSTGTSLIGAVWQTGTLETRYVLSNILRRLGYDEAWNDSPDRTRGEVLDVLFCLNITEQTLETAFGPNWRALVLIVHQVSLLTADQTAAVEKANKAAQAAGRSSVLENLTERTDEMQAAARAARGTVSAVTSSGAVEGSVYDAVRAEMVRDLISASDYVALTGPWHAAFPS